MSKIPYYFETPIPKYFRENGFFECEHMFKFINWSFSKCQTISHKTTKEGKQLTLQPFEFIAGRLSSPLECFLTENIFRNLVTKLVRLGLLIKTKNSLRNHYSCYVWNLSIFKKHSTDTLEQSEPTVVEFKRSKCKNLPNQITNNIITQNTSRDDNCTNDNQPNNQPITNHQPTTNHKERRKKIRNKEDHPSNLPSSVEDDLGGSDDFFISSKDLELIELYPGIKITQSQLDECIEIKGSLDEARDAMIYIFNNKGRTKTITNWPNALRTWTIKSTIKFRLEKNEARARKLAEWYCDSKGWCCKVFKHNIKDVLGLVFHNNSSSETTGTNTLIFIQFDDPDFDDKVDKTIRDKEMQKGRM